MKKLFFILGFIICFFSCNTVQKTSISFLDEYVIKDSLLFQNQVIGGLSGVDFVNNQLYFVVDDAEKPRILVAEIKIDSNRIQQIVFKNTINLNDSLSEFYRNNYLDLESIFVDESTKEIYLTSEGSVNKNKRPLFFKTDSNGIFLYDFSLPKSLTEIKNLKHNGTLEASTKSTNKQGFWIGMESPLSSDGEEPNFESQNSPIRITYFDKITKKATKQYAYQLENITKPSKGTINLNGLTAMLEFKPNHFLMVERVYQNEFGSYGNTVKIFEAIAEKNTTNIIELNSLKNKQYIPLKKRLLLDFDTVKDQLTDEIVDNLEGITLGPKLKNGNLSLLLISDDNFQIYGKQLNQCILLELKIK